jgi:hypothetical protein
MSAKMENTKRLKVYETLIKENSELLNRKFHNPNLSIIHDELSENKELIKYGLNSYELVTDKNFLIERLKEIDNRIRYLNAVVTDSLFIDLNRYKRYLNAISYDNTIQQPIKKTAYNIVYATDNHNYKLIKKKRYLDLSVFQILKILYTTHKIKRFDYRNSIKRLNEKKPLKPIIKQHINAYLTTIKANRNKNNITALKRKANNDNFIYLNKNNLRYKVILKQNFSVKLSIYSYLQHHHKISELYNNTISEFKKRFYYGNLLSEITTMTQKDINQ